MAAHILLSSQSGQLGGLELRLADEARWLKALGHRPTLAISAFPGSASWFESLRQEGLELTAFDPPEFFQYWDWRRSRYLLAKLAYRRRLQKIEPDLMHVAYAWTLTGGSRLWMAHACGVPTVISVHNAFPYTELTPWHARLMREAFRSVRGIYGVSESALQQFLDIYGDYIDASTHTMAIHNFVDTDVFTPSPSDRASTRRELGISDDTLLLGSVGRIDVQKEPLMLLRTFARVHARLQNAMLLFIGQGPLAQTLMTEVERLQLGHAVRILPFQPRPARFFAALDLHLITSRQEGFGITTAEAMSCAVPVIGSDVPGTRDVLRGCEGGLLRPYGDEQAFADACLLLLNDATTRRRMGEAGRRSVVARFSRPHWQGRIQEFYQQCLRPV